MKNWADSQVRFINRVVSAHDRDLFAERSRLGHINVMRRSKRCELAFEGEGVALKNYKDTAQFVCALTEDWTANSAPREWGAEVVLARLKQHDIWSNEELFRSLEREAERAEESKLRDIRNKNEAWLSDNHKRFQSAFSDIRVANMDKTERRKRRFEKNLELKN